MGVGFPGEVKSLATGLEEVKGKVLVIFQELSQLLGLWVKNKQTVAEFGDDALVVEVGRKLVHHDVVLGVRILLFGSFIQVNPAGEQEAAVSQDVGYAVVRVIQSSCDLGFPAIQVELVDEGLVLFLGPVAGKIDGVVVGKDKVAFLAKGGEGVDRAVLVFIDGIAVFFLLCRVRQGLDPCQALPLALELA